MIRRALAALALAGAAVLVTAAPAQAHSYLVDSAPGDGAVVTESLSEASVTMNENVLDLTGDGSGFALRVLDADGLHYETGCPVIDGPDVAAPVALGAAGDYRVLYQVVSADGHTVSDELDFTWQPPADHAAAVGAESSPCEVAGAVAEADPPAAETSATDSDELLAVVLWGAGGLLVLVAAAVATLLVLRRRG